MQQSHAPVSNRKRTGEHQPEQLWQALSFAVQATGLIEAAGSPTNKRRRAERLVCDAERLLRDAAVLVGARLR